MADRVALSKGRDATMRRTVAAVIADRHHTNASRRLRSSYRYPVPGIPEDSMTTSRIGALCVCTLLAACDVPRAPSVTSPESPPVFSVANDVIARDRATDRLAAYVARTPLSGGPLTVFNETADAFSRDAPGLSPTDLALHDEGDEAFDLQFVPGASVGNGGLGPVFDNTSCTGCHFGDGRGRPPVGAERFESMLFRASVPGAGAHGGPNPVPGFGGQLQMRAIPGLQPGLVASISYRDSSARFSDGATYVLRVPSYRFSNPYTPLPASLLVSPRVAPVVFGLGLLENVPDFVLQALADPSDRDRDGISGRTNTTWDVALGRPVIGRFGWKATVGTLLQQTAGAYNGDMGITSALFPAESCEGYRPGCQRHAPDVSNDVLNATAFYQATLGVPARRKLDDATARAGEDVFYDAGCASCHVPTLTSTSPATPARSRIRTPVSIHPYTDLLLHDMGPALGDNRADFLASGSEWRTAPLWGIGLVKTVNGHTNFLHDGRARTLLEAVLWHGGEAERARETVRRLPTASRNALIAFLESL